MREIGRKAAGRRAHKNLWRDVWPWERHDFLTGKDSFAFFSNTELGRSRDKKGKQIHTEIDKNDFQQRRQFCIRLQKAFLSFIIRNSKKVKRKAGAD